MYPHTHTICAGVHANQSTYHAEDCYKVTRRGNLIGRLEFKQFQNVHCYSHAQLREGWSDGDVHCLDNTAPPMCLSYLIYIIDVAKDGPHVYLGQNWRVLVLQEDQKVLVHLSRGDQCSGAGEWEEYRWAWSNNMSLSASACACT